MLKIDSKWGEDAQSLLQKSLECPDKHVRRRLLALYFIASGDPGVVAAEKIGVHRISVSNWVRWFNEEGLEGLSSLWKGQPGKILTEAELNELKDVVRHHPREVGIQKGRWSNKAVAAYVKQTFGKKIHHDTARNYLHYLGFSYRKPDKKLIKANPEKQKAFAQNLEEVEKKRCSKSVTVYTDEGSLYQDALLKQGWFLKEEPPTVKSTSPGKKKYHSTPPSSDL